MAFEDFKNERGSEINRIFKENKSILNERRKRASETTQRINAIKREIDVTKEGLNAQKSLREKQGDGGGKVAGTALGAGGREARGPPGAVGCGLQLWVTTWRWSALGSQRVPSCRPSSACGPSLLCLTQLGLHLLVYASAAHGEGGFPGGGVAGDPIRSLGPGEVSSRPTAV